MTERSDHGCAGRPDPFAGSETAGAQPPPQVESAEIRPTADPQEWFSKLQLADSGILYEDQYLQVRSKQASPTAVSSELGYLKQACDLAAQTVVWAHITVQCLLPQAPQLLSMSAVFRGALQAWLVLRCRWG